MPAYYFPRENQNRPHRDRITQGRKERPKDWTPANSQVQVDPEALGPDIRLRWIRRFITDQVEDKRSWFKRLRRGWVPVTVEELPDLEYLRDPDTGHIADLGCILCKIDAQVAQWDVEDCEDRAMGALSAASSAFEDKDNSDSNIRKKVETNLRKQRTSFKGKASS